MAHFYTVLSGVVAFTVVVCGLMVAMMADIANVQIPLFSEILLGISGLMSDGAMFILGFGSMGIALLAFWTGFCRSIFGKDNQNTK